MRCHVTVFGHACSRRRRTKGRFDKGACIVHFTSDDTIHVPLGDRVLLDVGTSASWASKLEEGRDVNVSTFKRRYPSMGERFAVVAS